MNQSLVAMEPCCYDEEFPCALLEPSVNLEGSSEMCQVIGKNVLRSDILNDMELYLECDDDHVYVMPASSPTPQLSKNVRVRVSFPSPPPDGSETLKTHPFQCDNCSKMFKRESLLKDHAAKFHNMGNLFKCSLCQYTGNFHRHLYKHMRQVHHVNISSMTDKSTRQSESGKKLPNKDVGPSRWTSKGSSDTKSAALTKSNSVPEEQELLKISNGFSANEKEGIKAFPCDECGKNFQTKKYLKEHIKRLHNSDRTLYRCEECLKMFKKRSWFEIHKKSHDNQCDHACDICEKKFSCMDSLKAHKIVHSDCRPYQCESCNKTYKTKNALNEHCTKKH